MAVYFGTEAQQRLQRKSDRLTPWIMETPGACLTGRLMAADDWDQLGWDVIRKHLSEDDAFAFRWASPEDVPRIEKELEGTGATVFGWNGFLGDVAAMRDATDAVTKQTLPDGMSIEPATGMALRDMQVFLDRFGIVPLSTAVLGGENCRARSILIRQAPGGIVAAGFVGMLQNRFSAMADWAWAGLIATDPAQRGKGLGRRVTAELIRIALQDLGAKRVIAFAAPDNAASIAMLTGCGMQPRPEGSYVATLATQRPTR